MESKNKDDTFGSTIRHLEDMSATTFTTCLSLARFYLVKKKALEEKKTGKERKGHDYHHCPFCCTPYVPATSQVRLLPKMKLTAKVKRLLKKHTENSESLGRFQQKLVNDYVSGANKLVMVCSQCRKTVIIPGQTRHDGYQQARQKLKDDTIHEADIPKTRKEKIKEKKKRIKRRKKEKKGDDDSNAGLKITQSTVMIDKDEQDINVSAGNTTTGMSANQEMEINSFPDRNKKSSSQKPFDKSIQNQLYKKKGTVPKRSSNVSGSSSVTESQKVNTLKPNVATWILSSKKTKTKNLTQQLGSILKQEENKPAEGSLADFLSSL